MGRSDLRKAVVTGGTGLVGKRLVAALTDQGTPVAVVSRNPEGARLPAGAEAHAWQELPGLLEGADAIFNLAGEGLADRRWSPGRKAAILRSRIESTRRIVEALPWASPKPPVLINASAIGFYGDQGCRLLDEEAAPGQGYLAEVCQAWEHEADAVAAKGLRLVKLRLGVVLAREGGALPKMAQPLRLFLGCAMGSGRQGISWIHIDDLIRLLLEAAGNPGYEGAINATSPSPLSQEAFTRALAGRLHRPVWPLPAPLTRLAARWLLGEMAEAMLLQGAYVAPQKALGLGFTFKFERAEAALADLL
jgi:uncharacterized protein